MGLLPEIIDGEMKELPETKLYTPPNVQVRTPAWEADGVKRDKTHRKDAPTMANIHECEMNQYFKCFMCGRKMEV